MERLEWLKHIREETEVLYDRFSPLYWVEFGFYPNETHLEYLQKFLGLIQKGGAVLSAACGAGRYDGILLEAGHSVIGIDQSAGMLSRARERFPQVRYEKMGLQEMHFREEFEGVICMDAMEHICPEDWPGIVSGFQKALKPGGVLYFTLELAEEDLAASYERAREQGLPVVFGELADEIEAAYEQIKALGQQPVPGEIAGKAAYHYYPSPEQVRAWLGQAGLLVEAEGTGNGYRHFIARKR